MSSAWPAPFQPVGGAPPPPPPPPPTAPGRSSGFLWFAAGGLVVAGIVGAVLVALNVCPGCFGQPTAAPRSTPTQIAVGSPTPDRSTAAPAASTPTSATSTPTAGGTTSPVTSGSPGPAGTVPPDIATQIEAVIAAVPDIRQLESLGDVPYFLVTREQFRADLQVLFDENTDLELLAAQGRFLQRLGLMPADADLRELVLELNGAGVGAYYRFDTKAFYVIERSEPFGALDRVFVAHEYTHALQDQHFQISDSRITDTSEGDAALAQLAIQEGDATTLMFQWAQQNLSFAEMIEMLGSSLTGADPALLAQMPPILNRQLEFPYADGFNFINALQMDDGWPAVDNLLRTPPPSTEQIMHPEKFAAGEMPVEVALDDVSADLGSGWTQTYVDTLGELNLQVIAAGDEVPTATIPGLPVTWPYPDVWTGWGGDRIAMWEGAEGEWAICWRSAWDSPSDADEFEARVAQLQSRFGGPVVVATPSPDVVSVLVAADQQTLDALEAALAP